MVPDSSRHRRAIVAVGLVLALAVIAVGRATIQEVEPAPGSDQESPYYDEALGPHTREVTTSSERAQAFFDQGVQMMYAFVPRRAARSFRQAQREDPACAMCYWGEAWALGPFYNGPMDADDAPDAYRKAQRAQELAEESGTDVERALAQAMAARYEQEHDPDARESLDSAYARQMGGVHRRFPDDADVATLYSEALMLLEPRRGHWEIDKPSVAEIHRVLEGALAIAIDHPGACHLYIHATEPTDEPERAEACAEHLGSAIPGASHIQHMPSHTYNRVGRWGDAVRANLAAWHTDIRAEDGGAWAIYPAHNLHMLFFAASMDGQGAIAVQAAKDYAKIARGGEFYHALALLRFGRFDEILELDDRPKSPIRRGIWDFARGYAHLRLGDPGGAYEHLELVRREMEEAPEGEEFRDHAVDQLLGVVGGILEAELLRLDQRRLDEAVAVLEEAVAVEDGMIYDEPEPLNFSARHWLGDVLLEMGRHEEAEAVFRAALEDHPMNGWSLFGLEASLRARGLDEEADRVQVLFEEAWARSDTEIRGPIL